MGYLSAPRREIAHFVHSTGGIWYHLRAQRYSRTLWQSHRKAVKSWFSQIPNSAPLLVLGPSAGYSLETEIFSGRPPSTFVDQDRYGLYLLKKKHSQMPHQFYCESIFGHTHRHPNLIAFKKLLEKFDNHHIVFCNLLGQMGLAYRTHFQRNSLSHFFARLTEILANRSWSSYHDSYSMILKTKFEETYSATDSAEPWQGFPNKPKLVIDHETAILGKGADLRSTWTWNFLPKRIHFIQGVHQFKPQSIAQIHPSHWDLQIDRTSSGNDPLVLDFPPRNK